MASCRDASTMRPHALVVAYPLQGHLTPLMRLSKTLAKSGFLITFVNADFIHRRLRSESPNPVHVTSDGIRIHHIPFPGLNLNNDSRISFQELSTITDRSVACGIEQLLDRCAQERTPVTCIFSDILLSTSTQNIADKFGIPRVAVFSSSQSRLLLVQHLLSGLISQTDAIIACRNRDNPSEFFIKDLPGLLSLRNVDLPSYKHIDDEFLYNFFSLQCKVAFQSAHAIVLNSFEDLEGPAFDIMRRQLDKPVYGVGPLLEQLQDDSSTSLWKEENDCLEWLERQPPRSVLYISFGSIARLPKAQMEEVCAGLEASHQRFLWAFRPDLVEGSVGVGPSEGFISRTQDRGYVVKWAPQLRVLSSASVGGFLTHCGWNSTMESIAKGIPMLCWPYTGDQFLNAKYIVEEWKIGLRCEEGEGELVGRGEVERVVRHLMEGEAGMQLSKNAFQLQEDALKSQLECGSSYSSLKSLLQSLY